MNVLSHEVILLGLIFWGCIFIAQSSECTNKNDCSECVQTVGCAWCSKVKQNVFEKTSQIFKCHPSATISDVCEENFMENPKTTFKITANKPMANGKDGDTVQIRPQEMFLTLKSGDEFTVDIEFRKAEDYPVDLYYLMDLSSSMARYKNNLSKLGNKLAETMKNLTTDFQLGFGSFVDKVTLPYTSTLPAHLKKPCAKCRSPYSFRNHMSLTAETERFSVEVRKAQISGNIDTPEGVLDGLMQAMACLKALNWREKARHIIVVSTDAPFHLAGDGKLGGVVEPHDGLCYLNEEGYYTHSLVFDYPSVSQINHKALEHNMNIIFAVVNKVKNEYLSLSKEIRGASLGLLDAGENIAELIKAQYEKMSTTIRLTHNARGPLHVTFSASCSKDDKWKYSNECSDVKGGSLAHFRAHIKVLKCSENRFNKQVIKIKPVGINESLTIHLETVCDCECSAVSKPGNEINSKHCSSAGDLICGKCICHEGRIGERCECSGDYHQMLDVRDTKNCRADNTTDEICSGRGECKCGVCQCHPRTNPKEEITGKFCECDNFSCDRGNGVMCSGHGTCECGECSCDPGWSGHVCDCPSDDTTCREETEEDVCSGKGDCVCGVCLCHNGTSSDEHRYTGKYCQICMTCLQQCDLYNDCVECLSYKTGPLAGNKCKNCSEISHHELVESTEEIQKNPSSRSCVSADHSGCTFKYVYHFNENDQLMIWAEAKTICPKEVNLYAVIAGTTGSTVLIGLLSALIWKIVTTIHDKREYEKFERERNLAKWGRGENPLFKTATTTYENPTYDTQPECT